MKRLLVLLGLAAGVILAPFSPGAPAQAAPACYEVDPVCWVADITCTTDDTLAEKSSVYKKYGPRNDCIH